MHQTTLRTQASSSHDMELQRSTKEEQTAAALLDLTRLSAWLHTTTEEGVGKGDEHYL